jgi:hypothetical protein
MRFIGIDPGALGGMACLEAAHPRDEPKVWFTNMPTTERGVIDWLRKVIERPCAAVVEKITPMQGVSKTSAASVFGNYKSLCMALVALGVEDYKTVLGQNWQKTLGIPRRKSTDSRSKWKGRLKKEAERRFPDLFITLATADALLIAYYCREKYGAANP